MTTILADARRGVIVSDSNLTDGERSWSTRKVHRVKSMLIGLAGTMLESLSFLQWARSGMSTPPDFAFDHCTALVLDSSGLYLFDMNTDGLTKVTRGIESIGTGGMGAMCAYEALGYQDPARAVRISCKHDAGSRGPVRTYRLAGRAA